MQRRLPAPMHTPAAPAQIPGQECFPQFTRDAIKEAAREDDVRYQESNCHLLIDDFYSDLGDQVGPERDQRTEALRQVCGLDSLRRMDAIPSGLAIPDQLPVPVPMPSDYAGMMAGQNLKASFAPANTEGAIGSGMPQHFTQNPWDLVEEIARREEILDAEYKQEENPTRSARVGGLNAPRTGGMEWPMP